MSMQVRLDKALVERGLASTRSRAQLMIKSGAVRINERLVEKTSHLIQTNDVVRILREVNPWVSRGGLKLEYAIKAFELAPLRGIAMDVGASTGGFTEVLLAYGCSKVYAIDVGRDQLDLKLKDDPRVLNIEGMNAKNLGALNLPSVDFIVCDVSFISISKVLQAPLVSAKKNCQLIALIKPQFEVGPSKVGKRGIVKDLKHQQDACVSIQSFLRKEGWSIINLKKSPILGSDGNLEFLISAKKIAQ